MTGSSRNHAAGPKGVRGAGRSVTSGAIAVTLSHLLRFLLWRHPDPLAGRQSGSDGGPLWNPEGGGRDVPLSCVSLAGAVPSETAETHSLDSGRSVCLLPTGTD